MRATTYNYPTDGGYADTIAILDDGRTAWINTQYRTVNVRHSADCAISKQTSCYPKAVCTCGADLSDSDKADLIADAHLNGKFGRAPTPRETPEEKATRERELHEYDVHKAKMDKLMAED